MTKDKVATNKKFVKIFPARYIELIFTFNNIKDTHFNSFNLLIFTGWHIYFILFKKINLIFSLGKSMHLLTNKIII